MKTIVEQKVKETFKVLKDEIGITNIMQTPKLEKVIVSVGTGRVSDNAQREFIKKRITDITGRKPVDCLAKKSIASFKVRQGKSIGYKVTLRGQVMYNFLEKIIHIVLPRTRDFRGINIEAIDAMGNLTIGIKEHTVFTESSQDESKSAFGLAITIVSTVKTKDEAEKFYRHIGIPLKKAE